MKTLLKTTVSFACILFMTACTQVEQHSGVAGNVDNEQAFRSREAEEAAIYSLLLNEDPEGYLGNSEVLLILNETYVGVDITNTQFFLLLSAIEAETLIDLRAVNQRPGVFNSKLSLNKPYEIIDSAEMNLRIDAHQDRKNPLIINTFSKVGFNKDLDQALVYMENSAGE